MNSENGAPIVPLRLYKNYDLYSVLSEGAGLPFSPRPEPLVINQNGSNRHKWIMIVLGVAVVGLLFHSFRKHKRRG